MNKGPPESTGRRPRTDRQRLLDAWQGIVALFFALAVIGLLPEMERLRAPGAPIILFWTTIGAGMLVVLAHLPFSFRRLRRGGRVTAYVGLLGFVVLWLFTQVEMYDAWKETPEGATEAKQAEAAERARAAFEQQEREADAILRKQQEAQKQAQQTQDQLERCFTTFRHRLPALESIVKDSLHNPHAFEHVQTEATDPDVERYNVTMTFRAQNGFGALRTWTVRAQVDPDTCRLVDVQSEPEEA